MGEGTRRSWPRLHLPRNGGNLGHHASLEVFHIYETPRSHDFGHSIHLLQCRDLAFFLPFSLVVSCDIRPGLFFYFVTTGQISNLLASSRSTSYTVLVSAQDHSCQSLLEFCRGQPSADARHFQLVFCLSSTSHLSVVSLIIIVCIGPHVFAEPAGSLHRP